MPANALKLRVHTTANFSLLNCVLARHLPKRHEFGTGSIFILNAETEFSTKIKKINFIQCKSLSSKSFRKKLKVAMQVSLEIKFCQSKN